MLCLLMTIVLGLLIIGLKGESMGDKCIALDPCTCEPGNREQLIDNFLESNQNEENMELFNEIFKSDGSNQSALVINCSDKSLKNIPNFKRPGYSNQPMTDYLNLRDNELDIINDSYFYGLVIRCIDLSSNRIINISRNAFKGLLSSLTVLKLSNNLLPSNATFPAYFISKLTLLQALDLSANKLDKIVSKSFQTMTTSTLKYLDLSANLIDCVADDAFDGCGTLSYLNMCHNKLASCAVQGLPLAFLRHMGSLTNLQLCSNELSKIEGGRENFKYNNKLRELNLEANRLTSLADLFCDPTATESNYLPSLRVLNLGSNQLTRLNKFDLACLYNLEELYLQMNKLKTIGPDTFRNLTRLRILHLQNNVDLIHSPAMFVGLENSLVYLAINFHQELKSDADDNDVEHEARSELVTVHKYEFDKCIDYLLVENNLRKLETIDMSESKFRTAYLNLAHLLLTQNRLRVIICFNCSIKHLKYKYEMNENYLPNHYLPENIDQIELTRFEDKYKVNTCERELNGRLITVDLNYNRMGVCYSGELRDEIDVNIKFNLTNCFNKRILFIEKLTRFVSVKNFHCLVALTEEQGSEMKTTNVSTNEVEQPRTNNLGRKYRKVDWDVYNRLKFTNYTHEYNCDTYAINCQLYYERSTNGEWISKLNSGHRIGLPSSIMIFTSSLICFYF